MRAAGVEIGAYHYLRGDSPGYEQADVFWDRACDLGGGESFALAVDLEDMMPPAPPWDRKVYGQRGADFLERLRHLSGRPCGVYGSPGYLATLALPAALAGPLWAAHWGVATPLVVPPWSEATIHQYAVIDGLDRNRFRGTRADFRRAFGLEVLTPTDEQLGALAGRVRRAEGRGDTAETFVAIDEGPVIPGGA
jgi:hypothetical protein